MARILIVDDSPTDARVISAMLERNGLTVSVSTSAEHAIGVASAELPDLILMDVVMPGMNGFQATRILSREPRTAHIPILILTTKSLETDRVWGLRQGAKDFLTKPPREADLVSRIQALLGH
ncbi:MAG: response regulator [Xanthomonadales bacterium]|jgi:twitching motility two-component system response regulator PilH|nr:response regulator [Xanthomonadales bacterium]